MSRELIEQAISFAGSQAKLADACGVKQQSIWQAKETGRCSAELALQIEQATGGKVRASALRPDLPWPSAPATQPQDQPDQHVQPGDGEHQDEAALSRAHEGASS